MNSVEPGRRFKTIGGLIVETTGQTQLIGSVEVYVHEVVAGLGAAGRLYSQWTGLRVHPEWLSPNQRPVRKFGLPTYPSGTTRGPWVVGGAHKLGTRGRDTVMACLVRRRGSSRNDPLQRLAAYECSRLCPRLPTTMLTGDSRRAGNCIMLSVSAPTPWR